MKKTVFKTLTIASSVLLMASCSSYTHSYRVAEIADRDLKVADKYVVDINHDFSKVVTATSGKQKSEKAAKEEAYYRAIVDNKIHVLVDPIYSIETSAKFLIFGGKSRASVVGFSGFYANPRPMSVEVAKNTKADADLFDQKVKDLEKLSKITALGSEEVKTFLIDTKGSACCGGDSKNGTATTGGSNFGQMHLLHTTTNKPSLIDQYNKLNGNVSSDDTSSSSKSSATVAQNDNDGKKKSPIKNFLSKIPLIGKLFK
jgi:hypothetical protein